MIRVSLWIVLLFLSPYAGAHDLGVSRITIEERDTAAYLITAKLPAGLQAEAPQLPSGCHAGERKSRQLPRKDVLYSWHIRCLQSFDTEDTLVFPWPRDGAVVLAGRVDGTVMSQYFPGNRHGIAVPVKALFEENLSITDAAGHYVMLGIEHILTGWDHLAFVLSLCLVARGWSLVKLVTAFTVGHSLTLALAVGGWVTVPVPPVEACIALSIAFMAREAFESGQGLRHGAGLVFAFAMLHGLGFASALIDSGISRENWLLGLLSFNIGVETGQLMFVFVVVALTALFRRFLVAVNVRSATAFGLGTLGMFWTFERIATFT